MKKLGWIFAGVCAVGTTAGAAEDKAPAHNAQAHVVKMMDAKGADVGTISLTQTPNGVLLTGSLKGMPAGVHAIHVHEAGKCDAPAFKTAGGHFNPESKQHGMMNPNGQHAGDLPNIIVSANGDVRFELLDGSVSLDSGPKSLKGAKGSSLVIHAKADDYQGQPAGNAGDRVACGVIAPAS